MDKASDFKSRHRKGPWPHPTCTSDLGPGGTESPKQSFPDQQRAMGCKRKQPVGLCSEEKWVPDRGGGLLKDARPLRPAGRKAGAGCPLRQM